MTTLYQRLRQSAYIRHIATLLTGKLGAAAVSFALVPIVARLFSPQDYGVAAVFVAVVVVAGPLSTLCYELAIVLPKRDEDAASLFHTVVYSLLFSVFVVLLLIVGVDNFLAGNSTIDALGAWIWTLPLFIVIAGINNALESVLVRYKGFAVIAKAGVLRALAIPGSRIALGLAFSATLWALITGYLFGILCRFWMLWRNLSGEVRGSLVSLSPGSARSVAREYRDFPIFNTPARFVRHFSENIPVLMFGVFYAPEVVGFYAMANRVVQLPAEALINAVRKVYLQRSAELRETPGGVYRLLLLTTAGLAVVGIIPFGLLYFYGQPVIVLLLGDAWTVAGGYAEMVAPWFYTMWITTPSAALYIVLRRQKIWLRIQVGIMVVRLIVFLSCQYLDKSPEVTLASFVAATVAMNLMIITYSLVAFRGEPAGAAHG